MTSKSRPRRTSPARWGRKVTSGTKWFLGQEPPLLIFSPLFPEKSMSVRERLITCLTILLMYFS